MCSISTFLLSLLTLSPAYPDSLSAGPMLGYADLREVVVWVQTAAPAEVAIRFRADGADEEQTTETLTTKEESWLIAKFRITGLEAGTAYDYAVHVDGRRLSFDYPLRFTTQTFWQYRHDPPDIRFGIGSCFYVNDPPDDRPGKPYGGDHEILTAIDAANPEFFIWMGDNIYYREPDFISVDRLAYRSSHTRAHPLLRPLLARTHHYALWDDHDYGPNDSDRAYPLKAESLALFEAFWGNPHVGMPDVPGAFCRFSWSDADFFLLDDRYHRAPNRDPDPDKDYLGPGQLRWLRDSLLSSKATFKFVVMGGQVLNNLNRFEAYTNYPGEHHAFMSWLENSGIEGVVFLSGDRHMSELLKQERAEAYPLYELTCSPLTAGTSRLRGKEVDNPRRVEGTLVTGKRNYGILEITGPRDERKLSMSLYDKDGARLWQKTLAASDLHGKGR